MWEETKYDADLVISVPDSGNTAAIGYAMASGLPFNHGLHQTDAKRTRISGPHEA